MRNSSITVIRDENLEDVKFNVKECNLAYFPNEKYKNKISSIGMQARSFKGIVDDGGHLISVVKKDYKLVSNREVLDSVFNRLHDAGIEYDIDPQHSYYSKQRMRLHMVFPDLKLHDSDSDIPLSLYAHNSYNQSEGIRIYWGAIRGICSNGLIIGKVLEKFYHKHTKGFYLPQLRETFDKAYQKIPEINNRIQLLEQQQFTVEDYEETEKVFGEGFLEKATEVRKDNLELATKWLVINAITYYISHSVSMLQKQALQNKLIKLTGI
jgi:hypothetical protein